MQPISRASYKASAAPRPPPWPRPAPPPWPRPSSPPWPRPAEGGVRGCSQGWRWGPGSCWDPAFRARGFCLSSAAALLLSVSLPRSPGLQGPERARLPRPRQLRAGNGAPGLQCRWEHPAGCGWWDLLFLLLRPGAAAGTHRPKPPARLRAPPPEARRYLAERSGGVKRGRPVGVGPRPPRAGPLGDLTGLPARRLGPAEDVQVEGKPRS